jgi:hypothetical protein
MRNLQACVVVEYMKGPVLYPLHDVMQSPDPLDFDGLLQSALEFVFATRTSSLTIKTIKLPFPATILTAENHEDGGRLTCTCYDLAGWSPQELAEIIPIFPTKFSPSKAAVASFPQILGDFPLEDDRSLVEGYTFCDMKVRDSERMWVNLPEPRPLTRFVRDLMQTAAELEDGQVVFKIPTYPLFEIQDLQRVHFQQYWLVKEQK